MTTSTVHLRSAREVSDGVPGVLAQAGGSGSAVSATAAPAPIPLAVPAGAGSGALHSCPSWGKPVIRPPIEFPI